MTMTPGQARQLNQAAEFLPATGPDEHPCVRLGDGQMCFFYYDGDGTLRVSVHFEHDAAVRVSMEAGVVFALGHPGETRAAATPEEAAAEQVDAAEEADETGRWTDPMGDVWDLLVRYTDAQGHFWHWAGGFAGGDGGANAGLPLMSRDDYFHEDLNLFEVLAEAGKLTATKEVYPAYRIKR